MLKFKLSGYLIALATVFFMSGEHSLFENVASTLALLCGMGFTPILGATYTPAQLIAPKAFGNGAANIATWRKQNTAGASTFDVYRTLIIDTPTAARLVTIEQGSTAADTVAQKILDAYALTANVPFVLNLWIAVPNNDYFEGFANNTDINGGAYGYTFA